MFDIKDFLLINSPIYRESVDDNEQYLPPLGQGYIATQLQQHGIAVQMVDAVHERLGVDDLVNLIHREQPDYVGLNVFTQNVSFVREIAEATPNTTTLIIGGQTVKHIYDDISQWKISGKAYSIIGEGELIIPALIKGECVEEPISISSNQRIKVFEVNSKSCYFPRNLDRILLDRRLFSDRLWINHYGQLEAPIITSRGCPYNCAFCGGANDLNKDSTIRIRSVRSIKDELEQILHTSKRPVHSIRILDDLFLRNKKSLNNAVEIFSAYDDLDWRGMAHVQTFKNNYNLIPAIKRSGCRELFIGVESGSERIRKLIRKEGAVDEVRDVVQNLLVNGIDVKGYFMMGLPTESEEDALLTYQLALDLTKMSKKTPGNFRTSVFQFRPYHGTELYRFLTNLGNKPGELCLNDHVACTEGRSQFSFHSGNYSKIDDTVLYELIKRTQELS